MDSPPLSLFLVVSLEYPRPFTSTASDASSASSSHTSRRTLSVGYAIGLFICGLLFYMSLMKIGELLWFQKILGQRTYQLLLLLLLSANVKDSRDNSL